MSTSKLAPGSASALVVLLATLGLAAAGHARTWEVPAQAPTIQAGVDSAATGDTVRVACGTYHEHNIAVKAGVYLTSATGHYDCVTIEADSLGTAVDCVNLRTLTKITGFTITQGRSNYGGGINVNNSLVEVTGCRIVANVGNIEGGGIEAQCETTGGAVAKFTDCLVESNVSGSVGGGAALFYSICRFYNCTFVGNRAPGSGGGGIYTGHSGNSYTEMHNSIIAFGTQGAAVACGFGVTPALTCCDIYGNAGGDWAGCISGQAGQNGNISADPLFCDRVAGDFTLASDSPCLLASCGLIGAFGMGCPGEHPTLVSVSDVGNDQGRQVRLIWRRTEFDAPGDTVDVTGYEIYRRQDDFRAAGAPSSEVAISGDGPLLAPQLAGWDYLGTVPAHGDSLYQFVAPTLCDSTGAGICWSVFLVRAATSDPFEYLDSYPDSGYSVDNLAPSPPPGLAMTSPTELAWEDVPDADFDYYTAYGSAAPELDETATLLAYTTATELDITGHQYDYYHVTATDFAGNQGEEASVSNAFAGVLDNRDVPAVYALGQNTPNPFSRATTVGFDLPKPGEVSLRVYDTQGRLVRTLAASEYGPGRHSVTWMGEDDRGNLVAPGLYFIRLEAGDFRAMKKAALLR